jgi:hypothetical protein
MPELVNRSKPGLPLTLWIFSALTVAKLFLGVVDDGGVMWFAVTVFLSVLIMTGVRLASLLAILLICTEMYAIWLVQGFGGLSVLQVLLMGCGIGQLVALLAPRSRRYFQSGSWRAPRSV